MDLGSWDDYRVLNRFEENHRPSAPYLWETGSGRAGKERGDGTHTHTRFEAFGVRSMWSLPVFRGQI